MDLLLCIKYLLFLENAAITNMQIKFGNFPYVIRKTKWNAPTKKDLVYVEGMLICGIFFHKGRRVGGC